MASPASAAAGKLGAALRPQFPILHQQVSGHPLVYLDNAASSQKPEAVVRAIEECYRGYYSNVHRGVHTLGARATDEYEKARARVAKLIHAHSHREVVITRNATEAINLVAYSWGMANLKQGDEVCVPAVGAEHVRWHTDPRGRPSWLAAALLCRSFGHHCCPHLPPSPSGDSCF